MANPTRTPIPINQGASQVGTGAASIASILLNVPLPETASQTPGHGLAISNANKSLTAKSDVNGLKMAGGVTAVAAVKRISYTGQPSADDTYTIGGKTYTWKASGATGDEINISGVDAAATYAALVARVLTDTATTLCTGVQSGTGATGTVTFTANTAGTDFTLTDDSDNATVSVITANVAGVKSQLLIDLEGTVYENTLSEVEIPILYQGSTRSIHVYARATADSDGAVTAGSAEAGTYLTDLMDALAAALNGDGPTDDLGYHSTNIDDSDDDIAAMMVDYFGTDASFSIVSNQLKIQAGATGTSGDNIKIYTRCLPSVPAELPEVFQTGLPDFDEGEVIHAGIQDEAKTDTTITTIEFRGSNAFGPLLNIATDASDVGSIKLFINRNSEFLRALVRNGLVTYNGTKDVYMSSNEISTTRLGIFIAIKSKDKKNTFDCVWYYDATIDGAITQSTALGDAGGYTVNLKLNQDLERPGDPRFVRWRTRALAA